MGDHLVAAAESLEALRAETAESYRTACRAEASPQMLAAWGVTSLAQARVNFAERLALIDQALQKLKELSEVGGRR